METSLLEPGSAFNIISSPSIETITPYFFVLTFLGESPSSSSESPAFIVVLPLTLNSLSVNCTLAST